MKLVLENLHHIEQGFELELDTLLEGRVVGILGPSGSGKTTLLELIAGLRHAHAGRILLDGAVIDTLPAHRRRIGYVPQDLALFPHLTVLQNLSFGMRAHPDPAQLHAVASMLEIAPLLGRKPRALSGGERQRVAFARAVLARPRLLLLDEPLSSLDQALKDRILPFLFRIRDETGIPSIYVTHSADEAMALCDQLLILAGGRKGAQGTPEVLLTETGKTHYRLMAPF